MLVADVKVRRVSGFVSEGFASGKPVQQTVENHFDPTTPIDMIVDVEGGGVTFWKTILSPFLMCGANGFEGVVGRVGLVMVGNRFVGLTENKPVQ